MNRLSRAEQNERNRALVLVAARRVFLARGYHAATLAIELNDAETRARASVEPALGTASMSGAVA